MIDLQSSMVKKKIVWQEYGVTRKDRENRNGHKAAVVWLTGLSGSGKSTLANALDQWLFEQGCQSYVLDGDNVRHGLNRDLDFSEEDRKENIRRVGEAARLFFDAGFIVIAAFISPYESERRLARELIGENFVEVFLDIPLDVCRQRDPKDLYAKAERGELSNMTGVDAPYERPVNSEIVVYYDEGSADALLKPISRYLIDHGIVSVAN